MLNAADGSTLAYRIGGDEFLIFFLHSSEEEIVVVEKIIKEDATTAGYNISTEYAVRGYDETLDDVIKNADNMVY